MYQIWKEIFSFLSTKSQIGIVRTCKMWKGIIQDIITTNFNKCITKLGTYQILNSSSQELEEQYLFTLTTRSSACICRETSFQPHAISATYLPCEYKDLVKETTSFVSSLESSIIYHDLLCLLKNANSIQTAIATVREESKCSGHWKRLDRKKKCMYWILELKEMKKITIEFENDEEIYIEEC